MYFELFGALGGLALILYFFAEFRQYAIAGVFASFVVMILGVWVVVDNIQIKTGEITTTISTTNQTGNVTGNDTVTGNINQTGNLSIYGLNIAVLRLPMGSDTLAATQTTQSTYVNIPSPPYFPIQNFLGIIFILLSIYTSLIYWARART